MTLRRDTVTTKMWGKSTCIDVQPGYEIHRIDINAGGYSSRHSHRTKNNVFIVLSGSLLIQEFHFDGAWKCNHHPGTVPLEMLATVTHRFVAMNDVVALEIYTPATSGPVDPDDIERLDEGGACFSETPAV